MDFFHQFGANQFVALAAIAAFSYIAKAVGHRIAKNVLDLNGNVRRLNTTILKTEIMWDKSADAQMYRELEHRERTAVHNAARI